MAYERALESERPDALFRDPFARLLAGDDIEAVAKQSADFSSKAQAAKFGLGDWEGFHGGSTAVFTVGRAVTAPWRGAEGLRLRVLSGPTIIMLRISRDLPSHLASPERHSRLHVGNLPLHSPLLPCHTVTWMAIRTAFIDAWLNEASASPQFVNIGAGMDTRPYRLPCLSGRRVIEVDTAPVIATKRRVFAEFPGSPAPLCAALEAVAQVRRPQSAH